MVWMFDFRTKFVTALVWVLAAIQLLMQPATGLLHSVCESHSHTVASGDRSPPDSFWQSVESTWHWLIYSGCCQHSHADRSAAAAKSETRQHHRCSETCSCRFAKNSKTDHSHQNTGDPDKHSGDSPVPSHDHHQCEICQVVFAARVNSAVVQLSVQTGSVPLPVSSAVPAVDMLPRFELPSRGPPAA